MDAKTARPASSTLLPELALLAEAFRKTMSAASGHVLDIALGQLGWRDLLAELPGVAIPMTFTLLGETGAHAPILNDVVLSAAGGSPGGVVALPYAGGSWVVWERSDRRSRRSTAICRCGRFRFLRLARVGAVGLQLAAGRARGRLVAGRDRAGDARAGPVARA